MAGESSRSSSIYGDCSIPAFCDCGYAAKSYAALSLHHRQCNRHQQLTIVASATNFQYAKEDQFMQLVALAASTSTLADLNGHREFMLEQIKDFQLLERLLVEEIRKKRKRPSSSFDDDDDDDDNDDDYYFNASKRPKPNDIHDNDWAEAGPSSAFQLELPEQEEVEPIPLPEMEPIPLPEVEEPQQIVEEEPRVAQALLHQCFCGRRFASFRGLRVHEGRVHGKEQTQPIPSNRRRQPPYGRPIISTPSPQFPPTPGTTGWYNYINEMRRLFDVPAPVTGNACPCCGKVLKNTLGLKIHYGLTHKYKPAMVIRQALEERYDDPYLLWPSLK